MTDDFVRPGRSLARAQLGLMPAEGGRPHHGEVSVASLRRRKWMTLAREIESAIATEDPRATWTALYLQSKQASQVAYDLLNFDRELRRASAILDATWRTPSLPSPVPVRWGGCEVQDATAGSTGFLVDAYGVAVNLLLSTPVQLLATTQWLLGHAARLRVFKVSGGGSLERMTATQAIEFMRELDDLDLLARGGSDRGALGVGLTQDTERRLDALHSDHESADTGPIAEGHIPGGRPLRRRRITHWRTDPDGTEHVIDIEEEW